LRIKQNVTGETADFLAWNLSTNGLPSYVLVRLDNGSLYEWKIDGCSIIDHKTSDAGELATTLTFLILKFFPTHDTQNVQQLQAKIYALVNKLDAAIDSNNRAECFAINDELRVLSAM